MAVLSDLLGFPHHTCARGRKVERPFLEDVCRSLGVSSPENARSKDHLILKAIEAATGLPADENLLSEGGTVTDKVLDVIIAGVVDRGLSVPTGGSTAARIAANMYEAGSPYAEAAFEALDLSDERTQSLRSVTDRPGQSRFRKAVITAYPGCAITGCLVESVLDAAHIRPFMGKRSDDTRNGICLRADLHRLWDRGLLAVHERTFKVIVHPEVTDTAYRILHGVQIALPTDPGQWPDTSALKQQREWCGL
jgi:hypothetical protein